MYTDENKKYVSDDTAFIIYCFADYYMVPYNNKIENEQGNMPCYHNGLKKN